MRSQGVLCVVLLSITAVTQWLSARRRWCRSEWVVVSLLYAVALLGAVLLVMRVPSPVPSWIAGVKPAMQALLRWL
ncbi:MAG: hypothetical protein K6T78_04805 [Alicyclobacillus sp.]|nr:hypothetical protein [Alicyclobacillus sp.]